MKYLSERTRSRTGAAFLSVVILTALASAALLAHAAQAPPELSAPVQHLWQEAAAAQNAHQYPRAADFYRQILAQKPDFVAAEVNLGLMLQLTGDLHQAISTFEHVLARHPNLLAPNLFTGLDLLKLGHPASARPYLRRAVIADPDRPEARIAFANASLQLGDYREALEQFTQSTKLNPRSAEAWTGLGATYLSAQKEMESDLRHMSSPFRTVLLAESYLEQGRTEKAVDSLNLAAAVQPSVPCVHSILGFAYLQESKLDEAAHEFGLDQSLTSGECQLAKLGEVALDARQGRTQDALAELRKIHRLEPAFAESNGDLYLDSFSTAEAQSAARSILDGNAPSHPLHERDVEPIKALQAGHYSACSTAVANADQLNVQELRAVSLCSYYTGNDERVFKATDGILKRSPNDPEALYWRIQSSERLGLIAITRAKQINPDSASLHVLTGDLLQEKGDLAAACAEYGKAIAIKPGFLEAHIGLARALNSDRKIQDAEHEIRFALQVSPDDPEANYLLGEILVNRRDFKDAFPLLQKAQHASPAELPYVHADLSSVYEERGDIAQAIAEIKEAIPVDVDGSYHYRLGRLLLKVGNRTAASAAFKTAEELHHQTDVRSLYQK